jgi:hypothetical protein
MNQQIGAFFLFIGPFGFTTLISLRGGWSENRSID